MMKIGIVGAGFVGNAVDHGFNKDIEKFIVDPRLGTNIQELHSFQPEFIFVCVPTPMLEDGSQDSKILIEVLTEISSFFKNEVVIIKSTVLPTTLKLLEKIYLNFIYNPEFLREKFANEDFLNSNSLVLGGSSVNTKKVTNLYLNHTECSFDSILETDPISASLMKYTVNTYLASKVVFFNQLHAVFKKSGTTESWKKFIQLVSSDSRIGDSHMDVPGHDGKLGFGGACFPKDTSALLELSREFDVEFSLLKEAIKVNNKIRGSYGSLEDREKEQGVSFNLPLK